MDTDEHESRYWEIPPSIRIHPYDDWRSRCVRSIRTLGSRIVRWLEQGVSLVLLAIILAFIFVVSIIGYIDGGTSTFKTRRT